MPALLYGIGLFALFAGLVMIGFGVPINEFSFGNTLISAGTTTGVGGLIIIGLGVVAGQVRRLAETLAVQASAQRGHPIDTLENSGEASMAAQQARAPLPARPRPEARTSDQGSGSRAAAAPFEDLAESFAPTLPNPEESPVAVEDEISLSPRHPLSPVGQVGDFAGPARPVAGPVPGPGGAGTPDKNRESTTGWRSAPGPAPSAASQPRPLHTANFDAMWPAEAKLPKSPAQAEAKADTSSRDALLSKRVEAEPQKAGGPAVLKSGVVDGMSYTLYVDGSIEAELPQGTLRFASIHELRSHLAKKS
jgi:hypothetical protein